MIFEIIGLIIGVMIFAAGGYLFVKENEDKESRKIYGFTTAVGAVIILLIICRGVIGLF